jgi:hypothetical protein
MDHNQQNIHPSKCYKDSVLGRLKEYLFRPQRISHGTQNTKQPVFLKQAMKMEFGEWNRMGIFTNSDVKLHSHTIN